MTLLEDRLIENDLAEVYGKRTPPDLAQSALARFAGVPAKLTLAPAASPWRRSRLWLEAACVLLALGLIGWVLLNPPAQPGQSSSAALQDPPSADLAKEASPAKGTPPGNELTGPESFREFVVRNETDVDRIAREAVDEDENFMVRGEQLDGAALLRLARVDNTRFWRLELTGGALSDENFKALCGVKSLRQLKLSGAELPPDSYAHLRKLEQLRELELPRCDVARAIGHIAAVPTLIALSLHDSNVGDDGIKRLAVAQNLISLDLTWCEDLTDAALAHLREMPQLESLRLGRTADRHFPEEPLKFTTEGLKHLGALYKLQTLGVFYCDGMNAESLEPFFDRNRASEIEVLSLYGCKNIDDAAAKLIAKFRDLRDLDLFGCDKITDAGLAAIASIKTLQRLDIQYLRPSRQGLLQLAKLPLLNYLRMDYHKGVVELAAKLPRCRIHFPDGRTYDPELAFGTVSTVATVRDIEALPEDTEAVNIPDPQLGPGAMATDDMLKALARLKTLKYLAIQNGKLLTDAGLAHIAGLPVSVLTIRLGFEITDEGMASIGRLAKLRELTLAQCLEVTDRGLEHLIPLAKLVRLDITGCAKLTAAGIKKLATALPNCKLVGLSKEQQE